MIIVFSVAMHVYRGKTLRLVGSFPGDRPVLGEAAEDLCVGGGHWDSGVRRRRFGELRIDHK